MLQIRSLYAFYVIPHVFRFLALSVPVGCSTLCNVVIVDRATCGIFTVFSYPIFGL